LEEDAGPMSAGRLEACTTRGHSAGGHINAMSGRDYREEIQIALAGEAPAHVPFTLYDNVVPERMDLTPLQARGLAICTGRAVHKVITPNVTAKTITEPDGSVRAIWVTPRGTVTSLHRRIGWNVLCAVEHPIKSRDDYAVVEFIVNDRRYEPSYDKFVSTREKIGASGIVLGVVGRSPLLEIQIEWLGQERFCYELADNEDALMGLYQAMVKKQRELLEIVARSPVEYVLYCGNLVAEMIGLDRVRDYVFPCYNGFADLLHESGKKMGVHLDANNRLILDLVRDSSIDFVEAFTPPPDCNVSVAEARAAWPGKCLWVNFPSSVHLSPDEEIRKATREIIRQAGDRKGFLMGITEDVPLEHLPRSISAILDVLNE